MNQKRKSIKFNNGKLDHFSWNRQANGMNIRIIPIIPTPNVFNFQIFSTPLPIIPTPPNYSNPPIMRYSRVYRSEIYTKQEGGFP